MSYAPYPAYKDSGVPWLGQVPEGWEPKKIKYVVNYIGSGKTPRGGAEIYTDDGIMILRSQNVYDDGLRLKDVAYVTPEVEALQINTRVQPADVLLNITGASIGRSSIVPGDLPTANVNQHVCIFRPQKTKIDPKFLHAFFCSSIGKEQVTSNENGTSREGLNFQQAGNLHLVLPPLEQQNAIADFLDKKTAEIDDLIAKKEELLRLLAEQRTALITHAVTKGLNPNAPMKPSGIDWLGDVPEGWDVVRLRHLLADPLKYGANESAEFEVRSDPRYIRITDVREDGTLREETFRSLPEQVAAPYLLEDGDILLARSGATVGKTFIYKPSWGRAAFAGYLIRARVNERVIPDFLYDYLQSKAYWSWLGAAFIQATIQNVSAEKYADLPVPVPPCEEQQDIVDKIATETASLDKVSKEVQRAVGHLREYRTAVITNAVTGKIKVA